ncbi:MAG: winged-helix domain-containing protein [Clostridiales bacterium]|nr:winged-helix domain-containing protein [Clostridiales bacterium]
MKFDVCIYSDDEIFSHMLAWELQFAGFKAITAYAPQNQPEPVRLYLIDADMANPPITPPNTPVIRFSSVKNRTDDSVEFIRPFQTSSLITTIAELLKPAKSTKKTKNAKSASRAQSIFSFSDSSHSVTIGGKTLILSPREYLLLKHLYQKKGHPVSRDEAASVVWEKEGNNTNVVDVYIYYLRKKLEKAFDDRMIHTVRNKGYLLKPKKNSLS